MTSAGLPDRFCWSRFGTEAGEPLERILLRKEVERVETGGTFYWGIGNSVAPGLTELLRRNPEPEVLFSPIKSRPKLADVSPASVVRWFSGRALDGSRVNLPDSVCVTSRVATLDAPGPHYALVCFSRKSLRLGDQGQLLFDALRNLRTGSRLGASQVTAIVERLSAKNAERDAAYVVALRAVLVPPYFLRLRDPKPVRVEQARLAA